MMVSLATMNAGKCQCISFNASGFITESDNALFNTGGLMGRSLRAAVPFIGSIYRRLAKLKAEDEPLFYPQVRLDLAGYSGLCDFIFTRVKGPTGERIVWFIYDHSLHYGPPKRKAHSGR
jgi:hypothetical protein